MWKISENSSCEFVMDNGKQLREMERSRRNRLEKK